jgi:ribonuclease D
MPLPAELLQPLSREVINELPIRRYDGPVHVVTAQAEAEAALAELAGERVIGFDTETRPAFKAGERYLPALAQVAGARAVVLFQLERADFGAVLAPLLAQGNAVKAGVGLDDDLRLLRERFAFEANAMVDLGKLARREGLKQSGVRYLAARFLGIRIPKGTKTSNWAARKLSPQQIAYAATDAWVCRELYLTFEALGLTR